MMCYALFRNEPHFVTIPAGEPLFVEGKESSLMYVLIVGEARVTIGGREMERLRPGAVVGEMSLVDRQPHSATVEAISDCEFACVDEKRFDFLVAETPGFALEIMRLMAQRLRNMDRLLVGNSVRFGADARFGLETDIASPEGVLPPQTH